MTRTKVNLENAVRIDLTEETYHKLLMQWQERYVVEAFCCVSETIVSHYTLCPSVGALIVTNHYRGLEKLCNPPANDNPWRDYYLYFNVCKATSFSAEQEDWDIICD